MGDDAKGNTAPAEIELRQAPLEFQRNLNRHLKDVWSADSG